MADTPDGAPKPDAIPDLKKVAEARAAPFDWSAGASKSAASVQSASLRTKDLTVMERLNTTGGRLAVMAVVMLVVGGGLSLTAFHESGGSAAKPDMEGLKSTIKNSYASDADSTGMRLRERDDSKADRMKVDTAKKGGRNPITGEVEGVEVPGQGGEGGDGGAPMNYEEGGTSRGSGVAAGSAQGQGKNGNGGTEAFSQGGGMNAPKLSSTGQIKFQGMRRVSGTAGFRGIQGRGAPSRTINNRGTSSNNSSASDSAGGARAGGSGFSSLRDKGTSAGALATGGGGGKDAAGGGGEGGGGEGGGGSGGAGGGGANVNTDGLDDMQNAVPSIPDLLAKAASKREKAENEEKKGHALMVLGQHPQAAYHFNKAKDYKKQAKDYENQANQQTQMMQDTASGMTKPKP